MRRVLLVAVLTLGAVACASGPPRAAHESASSQDGNEGAGRNGVGAGITPSEPVPIPGATTSAAAPLPANEAMVQAARSMLGVPYAFGGTEPDGFDCSGLVVYAANAVGVSLPRTAREQMTRGVPVARDQLEAGDLVFMRLKRRQLHVGIAVDATHFIHAPSRGGRVRIDSLDAKPYSGAYKAARRVISAAIVTSP